MVQPPGLMNSMDYGAIAVLRTLLLKIYRPDDWHKFTSLEHHNDDRKKNLPLWNDDVMVSKIIREQWNLGELFSEDEIHIVREHIGSFWQLRFQFFSFLYRYVEFMKLTDSRWAFSIPLLAYFPPARWLLMLVYRMRDILKMWTKERWKWSVWLIFQKIHRLQCATIGAWRWIRLEWSNVLRLLSLKKVLVKCWTKWEIKSAPLLAIVSGNRC